MIWKVWIVKDDRRGADDMKSLERLKFAKKGRTLPPIMTDWERKAAGDMYRGYGLHHPNHDMEKWWTFIHGAYAQTLKPGDKEWAQSIDIYNTKLDHLIVCKGSDFTLLKAKGQYTYEVANLPYRLKNTLLPYIKILPTMQNSINCCLVAQEKVKQKVGKSENPNVNKYNETALWKENELTLAKAYLSNAMSTEARDILTAARATPVISYEDEIAQDEMSKLLRTIDRNLLNKEEKGNTTTEHNKKE